MELLVFLTLWLANISLVSIQKESKSIALVSTIIFAVICAYSHTASGDVVTYRYVYDVQILDYGFEAGYMLLNEIFYALGFSFQEFRLALLLIGFFLIYQTVSSYTRNYNCIIALYAIILLYFGTVMLRYFLAFSLVVFAFKFLLKKDKFSLLIYGTLVLLAMSFHITAIFAFIFYIYALPQALLKIAIKVLNICACIAIVFLIVLQIRPTLISILIKPLFFIVNVLHLSEHLNLEHYIHSAYSRSNTFMALAFFLHAMVTMIARWFISKVNARPKMSNFLWFSYIVDRISMLLLPIMVMNPSIVRFLFYPLILSYIVIAQSLCLSALCDNKIKYSFAKIRFDRDVFFFLVVLTSLFWYYAVMSRHVFGMDFFMFFSHGTPS